MKNEKGITLASLVIYVLIFSATIALLASLSNYIYGNLSKISSEEISSEEFNKFNTYFVEDVKSNSSASISNGTGTGDITIKFNDNSTYTYKKSEKAIYKNKEKIARNIAYFTASTESISGTGSKAKKTIKVNIKTGKDENKPVFEKTINYVCRYW